MIRAKSPAAERNKGPILDVLRRVLPTEGLVLEIASGSGQHVTHFAEGLPDLRFVPSDPSAEARESIAGYLAQTALPNVLPPREIDVTMPAWEAGIGETLAAIVCINMIHIAPIEAMFGLLRGAANKLEPGAPLVLYGPYRFHGVFLAPSNEAFSRDLASRNPAWGVRDVDEIAEAATVAGFAMEEPLAMPANNHVLVLRRA